MLAITRTQYGPPDVLEVKEIEKPTPKDGELLIKVHATTINRTDCGILQGTPKLARLFFGWPKPKTHIMGTDFAGQVEVIGTEVSRFKVGDMIWGLNDEGIASQANYMVVQEKEAIVHLPKGFSCAEAVACAEGAHYAYNFINKISLKTGDKVMLNGATGAIGSAALQLLKHFGVYVTATANGKNIDLIKSLGADRIINYEIEDFTQDNEQYHYVFDAVGKSSFGKCKGLLTANGAYISSELGPGAENIYLPLLTKIKGGKRVKFPFPNNKQESLDLTKSLMEQGKFRAVIDRSYTIEQAIAAYQYVVSGQKTGNVVLELS